MTVIKLFVIISARGGIELCIFVVSSFIVFSTAVYYLRPVILSLVLLRFVEIVRIIIRKEIWIIRRGWQSTERISEATEMADGSRSRVLRRWGLSSILMGDRFRSELPKSAARELLKQS